MHHSCIKPKSIYKGRIERKGRQKIRLVCTKWNLGNGLFLEERNCSEYDGRFECDLDSMKMLVQLELSIEIDGYCWA